MISGRTKYGLRLVVMVQAFAANTALAQEPPAPSPAPGTPEAPPSSPAPSTPEAPPSSPAPAAPEAPPSSPAPAAPETPAEVTIAGTRVPQTAGSVHVLKERQLERFEHDDPNAVLAAVPGVYLRGEDGIGLRPNIGLRGANPDRSKKVTLLEDGVPFSPAPYSAPAAYFFPLVTRMTQVRVIKGPAAIVYGPQSVGGAIDLVTRPIPTETSGAIDLGVGQYGYGKGHGWVGSSDGKIGFVLEGIHLRNDGFKELPDGASTGSYRNEWMVKGEYIVDPTASLRNELRLKITYSDELSNETYVGLTDADFRENPLQRYGASALDRMTSHHTAIALTHVTDLSPKTALTTTIYRNDFSRAWRKVNGFRGASLFDVLRDPGSGRNAVFYEVLRGRSEPSTTAETLMIGPNDRQYTSHGIESRIRWDTKTGPLSHRVEYGVRLHEDRVERRHSEDGFLILGGELVPEGSPTAVTAFNEASTLALALHAVDAVSWRRLTLTPGVRVETMHQTFTDRAAGTERSRPAHAILPGIGAYYGFTKALGVLAGAYRGFSPPAPDSDRGVEPELSVNYEAGARYADGPARGEIIGFYNDYSNLTDVCTLSSGCVDANLDTQFNAGAARIYGLEAYAGHEIPVGSLKIPLSLAYTLTLTEFLTSFESEDPIFGDVAAGDALPYVPLHQINASLGLEHERAGGAIGATYVSRMREEAGSEPISEALATDEQFLLDASVWVRPLRRLTIYGNMRNVLDSHYIVSRRPFGARPNAPRWIQVGAKVKF